MNYKVQFSKRAREDMAFWKRSGKKKVFEKIADLVEELETHPYSGTGKPERLKGDKHDYWSRRIDKANRIIYSVHDDVVVVNVVSMKGHYEDK